MYLRRLPRPKLVGLYLWRALCVVMIVGIIPISLIWLFFSHKILSAIIDKPDVIDLAHTYCLLRIPSLVCLAGYWSSSQNYLVLGTPLISFFPIQGA